MTEFEGSLQDQLPPMPADFVIESSLNDSGSQRKKLSIVRRSGNAESPSETNEKQVLKSDIKDQKEEKKTDDSTTVLPTKMIMAKPVKLRRAKVSSGSIPIKRKTDENGSEKSSVSSSSESVVQPQQPRIKSKTDHDSLEKVKEKDDIGDEILKPKPESKCTRVYSSDQILKPTPESKCTRVYSSDQLLSMKEKDDEIANEVAFKLCEVASLHCESPYLANKSESRTPSIPTEARYRYTIDEMFAIFENMKDFGPEISSLRLIHGRRGGRWETPKVVKDEKSGAIVTVEDKNFSMSDMAEATKAMEMREKAFEGEHTTEEPINDTFVVYPRKEEESSSSSKIDEEEKEKEKEKEVKIEDEQEEEIKDEKDDIMDMPNDHSWMTNPNQDEWRTPSSYQFDSVDSDISETPLFSRPPLPDIESVLPQISSHFLSDNTLDQPFSMVNDYSIPQPPQPQPLGMPDNTLSLPMDMPSMPAEITIAEPETQKDDTAFPPMPDMDVEIVSEEASKPKPQDESEKPETQKDDNAFPELPDGSIVFENDKTDTILIEEVPKESSNTDKKVVSAVEEKHKEEPQTPEKTPKKHAIPAWERNARKEEKERKARELKALRYLAQAAPGSVPVSQAMKANVRDDDDDETEINVHAGVDEATIDTLYHGRIESPARRPHPRRAYDNPNRVHNGGRSPNNRYWKNEPRVRNPNNSEARPRSVDFPPLGAEGVEMPPDMADQLVIVSSDMNVPEPEVMAKPPSSIASQSSTIDDDEMTAFFMQ